MRAALLVALALLTLPACWPGHCSGAIRGINPEAKDPFPGSSWWWINLDTGEKDPPTLLVKSGMTTSTVLLEGPQGPVAINLEPHIASAAHSCASAGSIDVKPLAPLPPGDYALVLLLDGIPFPSITDDKITTWQGHRAIVRHYKVR